MKDVERPDRVTRINDHDESLQSLPTRDGMSADGHVDNVHVLLDGDLTDDHVLAVKRGSDGQPMPKNH